MAPDKYKAAVGRALVEFKGDIMDEPKLAKGFPHRNSKRNERSFVATSRKVIRKQKRLAPHFSGKKITEKTYNPDHLLPSKVGSDQVKLYCKFTNRICDICNICSKY